MFVCCVCCVLSGRGLCDEMITRPKESYRLWRVVCDEETCWTRSPYPTLGCRAIENNNHNNTNNNNNIQWIEDLRFSWLWSFRYLFLAYGTIYSTKMSLLLWRNLVPSY
jgi:hypothetical protein